MRVPGRGSSMVKGSLPNGSSVGAKSGPSCGPGALPILLTDWLMLTQ